METMPAMRKVVHSQPETDVLFTDLRAEIQNHACTAGERERKREV